VKVYEHVEGRREEVRKEYKERRGRRIRTIGIRDETRAVS
jgi:hypothetical protein